VRACNPPMPYKRPPPARSILNENSHKIIYLNKCQNQAIGQVKTTGGQFTPPLFSR